jgi:pyruvate/2-oxoglutarate/acetoin dehydrogenase E1 component
MGEYLDELTKAMTYLGEIDNSIFVGQAVAVPGTAMYGTLSGVDLSKRIEFPVEEDFQMGMSIGLAMNGFLPISIYPRWNFLLLAVNQIVNHLDKFQEMQAGTIPPVIIRTSIGSQHPMHPGPQHTGDFTDSFQLMTQNIDVVRLDDASQIMEAYKHAAERQDGRHTLLVEWGDMLA